MGDSILADKFAAKKVWLVVGVAWCIFKILTIYKENIGFVFMGESILVGFATIQNFFGFSEDPAYSVINKSVANRITPKKRWLKVGFRLLSTPFGALLTAPIAVGLFALPTNWRFIFIVLGLSGLLVLIVFMYFFIDTPKQKH